MDSEDMIDYYDLQEQEENRQEASRWENRYIEDPSEEAPEDYDD